MPLSGVTGGGGGGVAAHLLPPIQRPTHISIKAAPPPTTLPSASPPSSSSSASRTLGGSPSASSFSSTLSAVRNGGEIAIFGRSADPFNKDNWEEDFELDGPTDALTASAINANSNAAARSSTKPAQLAHITSGTSSDADDMEDWDEEIARDERTMSHSHSSALADTLPGQHAHRRSLPSLHLPKQPRDSPRMSHKPAPHQPPPLIAEKGEKDSADDDWAEEEEEDDEDWDKEIEAELQEAKQHSMRLSHKPLTPKPAVSFKDDNNSSSGHSHAASTSTSNNQLKATLHRMLGMVEDEDEEEPSSNCQTGDDANADSVGPTPNQSLLHLLSSTSESSHVNIVTYPPPSSLFSLRTAEGRREMTEKHLESWLKECVSKHRDTRDKCTRGTARFDDKSIAAGVSKGPEGLEAMLRDAACHINLLVHPSSLPISHPAYASLTAPSTSSTSSLNSATASSAFSSSSTASTAASVEAWSLLTKLFSTLAASTGTPALSPLLDTPRLYSLLYALLFLSCKLWTQARAKPFFSLIQTASTLLPSHTHSVELLEMECVAHHDGSRANKMLRIFVALFKKHWGGEAMDDTRSPYACECACQALTDITFYMTNCSPLTAAVLEQSAAWDPEDQSFSWLDRAWSGEMPTAEEGGESEALVWRLCGHPSYRIELMRGMYEKLEVGWVKARVAYTLGHFALVQSEEETDGQAGVEEGREYHLRVAEKYLMECIYIIDHIPLITPHSTDLLSLPVLPVLSSLSSLALILYADTLLALSKYPYAILAFESAHLSYSLRCPPSSPTLHALNKRLTDICTQHDDLPRSLVYHRKLLEKAQQDGNLNMYVYIVQEVGRLEVVQGQMRRAEEHLRSALAVLKPYTTSNASPRREADHDSPASASHGGGVGKFSVVGVNEVKSATINIFLQLARLYLDSERIVNAIVVLETLVRSDTLPRSKAGIVNLLLATAYMKRRRYKRAERILKTMEMAQGSGATGGVGAATKKGTMQMGGLSVAGGDILNSLDYLLLRTKCHYHAGDYTNALYWIDLSLSICSASSLSTLARLHYRKGKIYQAALYASISPPDTRSESFFPPPLSPPFMANGCVMPDPRKAITSLYDAYHFYETLDDRVHQLKCLTRIVDIYTHITFTPVVLFHQSPASLVPWLALAEFDVSGTSEPFAAFLTQVGELAEQTLASSLSTLALFPLLSSYLSLAEIRAMQGQHDASLQYWQTAKDTFFSLLVAGLHCVATCKASPGWVSKVRTVLQRMVRLMMAGGGAGGGRGRWRRRRLDVLEVWTMWELEMGMEQRKGEEEDERDEAKKVAEASETSKEKAQEKDDKRKDKHAVQKLDLSLLHVFSHHSFDKEPASPSSPRPPSSSITSSSSSALLRRRLPTSKDAWSEHRSVAFGALGSRSKNSSPAASAATTPTAASSALLAASPAPPPSAPVSLSLTPLDAAALKSISSLSDKIHASLYEMGRWRDQYAAGKLTHNQLYDRNHHAFNRMRAAMAAIRQLNGSAHTPSSRLSHLLPSNHTTADPLYSNLFYLFCIDGVCVCYSPKLSHTMLRLLLTPGGSPTVSTTRLSQLGGIFAPPATANNGSVVPSGPSVFFDRLVKEFYASAPTRASPLQSDKTDGASRLQPIEESKTAADPSPTSASVAVSTSASVLTSPSAVDSRTAARDEACETCGCEWYVHHPHSDICKNCYHHHSSSPSNAFKRSLDEVKEESDTDSESEEEQVENSLFCPSDTGSTRAWSAPSQYQVAVVTDGRPERLDKDDEDDGEELNVDDIKLENSSPSKPSSVFSTLSSSSSATVAPSPSHWSSSPSSSSAHSSELDALLPPPLDILAFQELFSSLDPQNILTIFSALFSESQLIFTSSSLFRLSSVITSLTRLMYPFAWQHTYVPLLSATALPLLSIHQPYIVGVHTSLFDPAAIPSLSTSPAAVILPSAMFSPVVVDCDRNSVRCSVGSFLHFPVKCKQRMYKHIVKFQSQMFLLQAEGGLTQEDRDANRQLRQREQSVGGVGVTLPLGADVREARAGGTSTTATSSISVIRSVSGASGASRSEEERPAGAHPSSPSLLSVVPEERPEEDTEQRRKNAAAQWRKANAALRTLRDGFIAIFLSLFSNYPLFLTTPTASAPAAASTPISSSAVSASPPSAATRLPSSSASTRSTVAFPFDLPSFLYHAKPHYSSFLHAITRTRLFRQFILLRASPYMQQHRAQMRLTLQTEREGTYVHWKDILHHPSTSANSAPSATSVNTISRTAASSQAPASSLSSYLFDDLCLRRLHGRLTKLHDRERLDFHEAVVISRANGPHKKRFLVLEGSRLRIYGSRRLWEKKGGGEVKYERRVGRGVARVGVGAAEGEGKKEWELIGGVEYDGSGNQKGDGSWHVRSESEESKKRWVKLLQARCMTDEMRKQWEAVV